MYLRFWKFILAHRATALAIVFVSATIGSFAYYAISTNKADEKRLNSARIEDQQHFQSVITLYKTLTQKIAEAKVLGLDTAATATTQTTIRKDISAKNFTEATTLLTKAIADLDAAITQKQADNKAADEAKQKADEAAKQQGTVKGKVTTDGSGLASVTLTLLSGTTSVTKATSDKNGDYSLAAAAGRYTLSSGKSGYTTDKKSDVTITAGQTITLDITLTKASTTSTSSSTSASASTAHSSYERKSISTSRGTFTADVMTFDLGSGHIKVMTDTASDSDCSSNCPVTSLSDYVSRNNAFAGINGTYFCPADYSACSGESGSFFWKVFNSRLNKMINGSNGLGENDAFLAFTSSGVPKWFSAWSQASGYATYAGINSKPTLVSGGNNVLDEGSLDDKQKNTKSNRGALGLKGQTLYAVIAKSATIPDLAEVMHAIGVDYGLNIDGGGSSAMIYNSGYKTGPGRNIPNAMVFVEQ